MKAKYPFFLICSSLALTTSLIASQDDWSLNNKWAVYGDLLYMKRTTLDNKKIVKVVRQSSASTLSLIGAPGLLVSGTTTDTTTKGLGTKKTLDCFRFEPGYRVGILYNLCNTDTFEGSYTHIKEWDADHKTRGDANLFVPFTSLTTNSDYFNASSAREEYRSQYDSAEINWWHHFTPRRVNYFSISSDLGLRYIQVDEEFHLAMKKGSNVSSYNIDTENRLYGGQLGGTLQWNPIDNLSWELLGKAGVFYNALKQDARARDLNNTVTLGKYDDSGGNTAFLGEAWMTVSYQFGCYFNVRLGYHFIYVTGLALAPKQFALDNTPKLNHSLSKDGEAILHGAFVGLNISF